MDLSDEERYRNIAGDQPDILCSQVPQELLVEAASEAEPTPFFEEFFATGYIGWLANKHGRRIRPPQVQIDRAILVLWYRACLLSTGRLLGQSNEFDDQPFFSDEGLY